MKKESLDLNREGLERLQDILGEVGKKIVERFQNSSKAIRK